MWLIAVTGGDGVLAGDLLDWVDQKQDQIRDLVPDLLMLAAAFFALVAWVVARSWKKAMVAGIGGAIVIAVVNQLGVLSNKVGTEIDGAPRPPAVVIVVPSAGRGTPT